MIGNFYQVSVVFVMNRTEKSEFYSEVGIFNENR